MSQAQQAKPTREEFIKMARDQMSKFERKEAEYRAKERNKRAAELQLPLN